MAAAWSRTIHNHALANSRTAKTIYMIKKGQSWVTRYHFKHSTSPLNCELKAVFKNNLQLIKDNMRTTIMTDI